MNYSYNKTTAQRFRPDIQGLRALSVLAVLLFHFQIPGCSGGFAGVDVFFVISGFLMTTIIVQKKENGSFSLTGFYLARGRRIIPPLLALVFTLLILGWFWLPFVDYKQLASESNYALTLTSNLKYLSGIGYFDTDAHGKWLLHTWSLSVEWQFYFVYPLFILLVWKIWPGEQALFKALFLLFMVSWLLSGTMTFFRPEFAFYHLLTRAWEMAAGGLVVWSNRHHPCPLRWLPILHTMGLVLLLASFCLLSNQHLWPGFRAILPVLAAALLIHGDTKHNPLLCNPVLQWIGDRSYSIYLWHWPFVVLLWYLEFQSNWTWIFGSFAGGIFFGHLSFLLLEQPWRTFFVRKSHRTNLIALLVAFLVVYTCSMTIRNVPFRGRLNPEIERIAFAFEDKNPRQSQCLDNQEHGSAGCVFGEQTIGAVVIGDSHTLSLITAAGMAAARHGKGVVLWGRSACPPVAGLLFSSYAGKPLADRYQCKNFMEWIFAESKKLPADVPLILVGRFSSYVLGREDIYDRDAPRHPLVYLTTEYEDGNDPNFQQEFRDSMVRTACTLAKDRPVYMLRPFPEMPVNVPVSVSRNLSFKNVLVNVQISRARYAERNRLILDIQDQMARECGIRLLDPLPYLCDEQACYGTRKGQPIYIDEDHLNEYGGSILVPLFDEVFATSATVSAPSARKKEQL